MMNTVIQKISRPSGIGLQSATHAGGGRVYQDGSMGRAPRPPGPR